MVGTDSFGSPSTDPLASSDFSVNFEERVPNWDEILLATGTCNHWMVMTRESAIGGWYSGTQRQILKSYLNLNPYTAIAYRR